MIKILLVDDEKGITETLRKFFEDRGFHAEAADSGEKALDIIKKSKPNIVFLDIKMPGIDGLETLKRIKKLDDNIKVIMLTVIDSKEIIDMAKELGADEYITKPFMVDYLDEVVIKKVQGLLNEKPKK